MAETVTFLLEDTVPELEDLQRLRLFSRAEVKAIVRRRTDFEYALKRRVMRKADVLRYAAYEMNLDALRRLRKRQRGVTKTSLSDHTMVRRVHFIFERGVRKFAGDLRLWLQFIDYARRSGSRQTLTRLFARALQFHPLTPGMWIMAASWEYDTNGNVPAARTLMQRALRLCPDDENLWTQYFRLELLYLARVRERRDQIAGLVTANPEADAAVQVPVLDHEKQLADEQGPVQDRILLDSAQADSTVAASTSAKFLRGAIPRAVYNAAIAAVPRSVALRRALASTASELDAPTELVDEIYSGIERDFADSAAAVATVCERGFPTRWTTLAAADAASHLARVFERYNQRLTAAPDAQLLLLAVQFFQQRANEADAERLALADAYVERALALAKDSRALRSEQLWLALIEHRLQRQHSLSDVASMCNDARADFPNSAALVLAWARVGAMAQKDMDELLRDVDQSLPRLHGDTAELLRWRFRAAALLLKDDLAAVQARLMRYADEAARTPKTVSLRPGELEGQLVLWTAEQRGLEQGRAVADRFLARPAPGAMLVEACRVMETTAWPISVARLRRLYQFAVDRAPADGAPWLAWIAFELAQEQFDEASALYARALKSVADATGFVARYTELTQ